MFYRDQRLAGEEETGSDWPAQIWQPRVRPEGGENSVLLHPIERGPAASYTWVRAKRMLVFRLRALASVIIAGFGGLCLVNVAYSPRWWVLWIVCASLLGGILSLVVPRFRVKNYRAPLQGLDNEACEEHDGETPAHHL